ncbi:S-formylglutathione hydrolase FrmB [Frankineae bacterium MT45]|nr:S-formylglutathione hydrolase FrmB [Frankineae bacterium MT45]
MQRSVGSIESVSHQAPGVSRRWVRALVAVTAALAMAAVSLVTAQGRAGAAICIPLLPCSGSNATPTPPTAAPGTPVPQLTQLDQAIFGGTNPKLGDVVSTASIGVPNAGVVPVAGLASARADDGAFVAYESRLDARTLDLMVYSPALKGAAPVRLLLPPNWSATAGTKWPSVYLLHGGDDKADYQSWSLYTPLAQDTANVDALFVMPSSGNSAYVTNYWEYGNPSTGYQYDTFVATEIPQLLQRGYAASTKAVVAGLSSGGFGAMALPALHPGEYGAAASYSGLIDTSSLATAEILEGSSFVSLHNPYPMWGDFIWQNSVWTARDPAALVSKLKGVPLFISAGNGNAGPLDPAGKFTLDVLEPTVLGTSQTFVQKAKAAGDTVTTDFYGNGTHAWPYWNREFNRSWPMLAAGLGLNQPISGTT